LIKISNIAIIPARGGSKRIPRKNLIPILGVPIIARTIENIKSSGVYTEIIVSTEDEEIAEIATMHGARAEFKRLQMLSDDFTTTKPVVIDAIKTYGISDPDTLVCVVYATSVLIKPAQFLNSSVLASNLLQGEQLLAVKSFTHPIERSLINSPLGGLEYRWPEFSEKRTQDLPVSLFDCGQFYWARQATWVSNLPLTKRYGFQIGNFDAIDLDEMSDLSDLEILLKLRID
jgi:pseudaminic acid cytidylyltransferase